MTKVYNQIRTNCARNANVRVPTPVKKIELPTTDKVSRKVVEWISQFTDVMVFEDLKDMRESIDYGTRMNRRLHSLPFAALQEMVSYKAG